MTSALIDRLARSTGILPSQTIMELIRADMVRLDEPPAHAQIQPASMDLRLGKTAYRVRASFLPGRNRAVNERLRDVVLHEFDLTEGGVLETGCVYIVPLMERLALPTHVSASANPKSSTGRLDVFTRVITDKAVRFDHVPAGYHGPLYAEITPSSFPVKVRAGSRLSQIRFRVGDPRVDDDALKELHGRERLVDADGALFTGGVALSVDLAGFDGTGLIGWRAKRHVGLVDMDRPGAYDPLDYWERLDARGARSLVLEPDAFYILASKESVHVPPMFAAEMVAFDPMMGEFRVHYAGFFDPGFGHAGVGGSGARAVLEVRSREVPFILEHGQIVGRLVYERMTERPSLLYGGELGSNYQAQGLKLSKHFR